MFLECVKGLCFIYRYVPTHNLVRILNSTSFDHMIVFILRIVNQARHPACQIV